MKTRVCDFVARIRRAIVVVITTARLANARVTIVTTLADRAIQPVVARTIDIAPRKHDARAQLVALRIDCTWSAVACVTGRARILAVEFAARAFEQAMGTAPAACQSWITKLVESTAGIALLVVIYDAVTTTRRGCERWGHDN
jgi:hypothetical protein